MLATVAVAAVALAAGGCGGEARSATATTVRDSAGVQIVESNGTEGRWPG